MSKADIKSSGEIIFNNIALMIPKMYLPSPSENMTKWAAVACDQYTSQPEYWKQAEKLSAPRLRR